MLWKSRKKQEKFRDEEISPSPGARGYAVAMPKWDAKENELLAKGITP